MADDRGVPKIGYDPNMQWEHSDWWKKSTTPGGWADQAEESRLEDESLERQARNAEKRGYTAKKPGPGGSFDYPEFYRGQKTRKTPEIAERDRQEYQDRVLRGAEEGDRDYQSTARKKIAWPGGYKIGKYVAVPSDVGPGDKLLKIPGQDPRWNDPMLGPGQVPPNQPGANPELLPGDSGLDYIVKHVWPMYGGQEEIAIEDLPGYEQLLSGDEPWKDPRVPWPSNVPRSPESHLQRGMYGEGDHIGRRIPYPGEAGPVPPLPRLPEGVQRQEVPLRQLREGPRPSPPTIGQIEPQFAPLPRMYPPSRMEN